MERTKMNSSQKGIQMTPTGANGLPKVSQKARNALYISISVVFADYDKIEHFMKIDAQMDPKSHPKIDIWAIRASTFEVSGGFGRSLIFDEFSNGKKSA